MANPTIGGSSVSAVAASGEASAEPSAPAARNRDKALMLIATAARMGVGLLTFVLLARYLGPEQFGVIATAMAYAAFVSLATDYGLATSALRRASAIPAESRRIVGDALATKAALMVAALAVSAAAIPLIVPGRSVLVYLLVFAGTAAFSMADLMMVAARANRRFDVEARLVVSSSVAMLLLVGGVAAATGDVLAAAAAFAVTRLGYLVLVAFGLRRWLDRPGKARRSFAEMRATLRESAGYAVDNLLTNLSNQMDVLLFALLLTTHDIGIYQSGARLVQVIVPFAVVLANVHIPALAAAAHAGAGKQIDRLTARVTLEFTVLALLGGLAFLCLGPFVTDVVLGERYREVHPLWPGFAAYVMLKFGAVAFNVQWIALENVRIRIAAQIVSILGFVAATLLLLRDADLERASWLLALSAFLSYIVAGLPLIGKPGASFVRAICIAGILLACALIIVFS